MLIGFLSIGSDSVSCQRIIVDNGFRVEAAGTIIITRITQLMW